MITKEDKEHIVNWLATSSKALVEAEKRNDRAQYNARKAEQGLRYALAEVDFAIAVGERVLGTDESTLYRHIDY